MSKKNITSIIMENDSESSDISQSSETSIDRVNVATENDNDESMIQNQLEQLCEKLK
jgi:hypothetical protein